MSKNREGMHKEWHTKRLNFELDFMIEYFELIYQTYDLEKFFGSDVATAFYEFLNLLYEKRNGLDVVEICGRYLVEYGYNWVPNSDGENSRG